MKPIHRLKLLGTRIGVATAIAMLAATSATAHPGHDGPFCNDRVHENGVGPDPDGDTNPATMTGVGVICGAGAETPEDQKGVIDFEPAPNVDGHGDIITEASDEAFGKVLFAPKVTRQVCRGMRHFRYDSACTYAAAPSGAYAALHTDYLNDPLVIEFEEPVCVVAMSIYPTGGKPNEVFKVTIKGWTGDDQAIAADNDAAEFEWQRLANRPLRMAYAYFLDQRAAKIAVTLKSKDAIRSKAVQRYLIDDLAVTTSDCESALADYRARHGLVDPNGDASAASSNTPVLSTAPPVNMN